MKRKLAGLVLLAALSGQAGAQIGSFAGTLSAPRRGGCDAGGCSHGAYRLPELPGYVGATGEPINYHPSAARALSDPAEAAARATFAQSLPPDIAAAILYKQVGKDGVIQASVPPGGGLGGPMAGGGLTVLPPQPPVGSGLPGAVAAVGALTNGAAPFPVSRTSVRFAGPNGMKITWYAPSADGQMAFAPSSLEAPARYNFAQAAIYRLKLSNIPGLPGVELYPTLEVVPANAKTATFLAHSSVPVTFTRDDFEQVSAGNYLVKVIYLPFPQYQDLAAAGPFEIVSTRLEPGVDPIKEAQARGHILLIIRLGNIDLEAPNTPAMDAPAPFGGHGLHGPHHSMGGPGMPLPPGMMAGPGMGGPMMPPAPGSLPGMMPPPPGMMPPGMVPPGLAPGIPTSQPKDGAPPTPSTKAGKAPTVQPVSYKAPGSEQPAEEPAKKSSGWLPFLKK